MISISKVSVSGWEAAIRGMRNPKNSWDRSDSDLCTNIATKDCTNMVSCGEGYFCVGNNDMKLMKQLFDAGTEHRKYLRFIHISMDCLAPIYWWKEASTYTFMSMNSCSTMHKLTAKPFEITDFSTDHLSPTSRMVMHSIIGELNHWRDCYIENGEKVCWWQMIQMLPMSYNQLRTLDFNYETAANIIRQRKNHKLDEWHVFCDELMKLPYMKELMKENGDD